MPRKTYTPREASRFKQIYIPGTNEYTDAYVGEGDYMAISSQWIALRTIRLQKDGYRCALCGAAYSLQVHHIRYPAVWGLEDINDLVTLCDECHGKIHGKTKGDNA